MGPRLANPPQDLPRELVPPRRRRPFLWPGYGENVRVLKWMVERIRGGGQAVETPIGYVPAAGALDLGGLDIDRRRVERALAWDRDEWLDALADLGPFFDSFGRRLPGHSEQELDLTIHRLEEAVDNTPALVMLDSLRPRLVGH